jgi:hypothetical protein
MTLTERPLGRLCDDPPAKDLTTARALGLRVPEQFVLRVHEVIEWTERRRLLAFSRAQ